jgi:hypothetical protein
MVTADERVGARMAGAEKAETDSRRARATVAIIFCERGEAVVSVDERDARGNGPGLAARIEVVGLWRTFETSLD